MTPVHLDVIVHHDSETSAYWAESPQLPGCHAAGKTLEELRASLQEAVALFLEDVQPADLLLTDRVHLLQRYHWSRDGGLIPA